MTDTKSQKKKTGAKKSAKNNVTKPLLEKQVKELESQITELEQQVESLESELDDQQERTTQAEEKMLRVVAEYENGKKRLEREKERSLRFAKERVLIGLFPIIDNLERSAKFEKEDAEQEGKEHGVKLVLEQIAKYLKEMDNVESYDPVGETFDPELHEAMAMHPSQEHESGVVMDVFEKGYRSGDRILRAAKVVVSQ